MTPDETKAVQTLLASLGSAEQEAVKIVAAVKAAKAGDKSQLIAMFPEIVVE